MSHAVRTEANLRAYAVHQRVVGSLFWLPTVLLYLIDQVGLTQALQLGALYYLTVVVLEVPSGWFSDHVGRVAALRVTGVAWVGCHALFLVGGLAPIAGAQVLLAIGYAFLSGTDSTFHFDVLDADGRSSEFERREARVRTGLHYATAITAIIGGCLAFVDLRLPFAAALVAAARGIEAGEGLGELLPEGLGLRGRHVLRREPHVLRHRGAHRARRDVGELSKLSSVVVVHAESSSLRSWVKVIAPSVSERTSGRSLTTIVVQGPRTTRYSLMTN